MVMVLAHILMLLPLVVLSAPTSRSPARARWQEPCQGETPADWMIFPDATEPALSHHFDNIISLSKKAKQKLKRLSGQYVSHFLYKAV